MCSSNQQSNPNNDNKMRGNQGNLYPDLSQFQPGVQQNLPIMQLLEALGLVPPGTQYTPSAPSEPVPQAAPANGSPQATSGAGESTGTPNGHGEAGPRADASQGTSCHNCQPQPSASNSWGPWTWTSPPGSAANQSAFNLNQQQQQCNFDFPRFFTNLGKILKSVFQCTTRVSSLVFLLIFIHLLTPVALLQNLVFMVLASGLGLHMPTLLAGQVLWAGVGCLRMFEPFFLAGLLIFSVHKMFVRKEPLVDQQFWRNRFTNFSFRVGNENFQ